MKQLCEIIFDDFYPPEPVNITRSTKTNGTVEEIRIANIPYDAGKEIYVYLSSMRDDDLEAVREYRKKVVNERQYWLAEKKSSRDREYAKFTKAWERHFLRDEKASTIMIDWYEGRRPDFNFDKIPEELKLAILSVPLFTSQGK